MKNIVLVGFMGTGKTEVSKILAQRLKKQRLCLDDMIEWKEGKPISKIFDEDGEEYFRKVESEMVASVSKDKGFVIDAGGGTIINPANLKRLKETGVIFCLEADADTILKRTKGYAHRPLLNTDNPKLKIEQLLKARRPYYEKSDYIIDTASISPDEAADKIISIMVSLEEEKESKMPPLFL